VSNEEREYLNEMIRSLNNQLVDALRERDEMHRELRKAETESSMLRIECGVLEKNAEMTYENHQRIVKELTAERDEARRLLKAVVDMMRDNMAPDAMHPKHVCDFIYCPEVATCMVCENWTDALVMCYPDDFQDEEETK
jgi:regulator of replication initiation timing